MIFHPIQLVAFPGSYVHDKQLQVHSTGNSKVWSKQIFLHIKYLNRAARAQRSVKLPSDAVASYWTFTFWLPGQKLTILIYFAKCQNHKSLQMSWSMQAMQARWLPSLAGGRDHERLRGNAAIWFWISKRCNVVLVVLSSGNIHLGEHVLANASIPRFARLNVSRLDFLAVVVQQCIAPEVRQPRISLDSKQGVVSTSHATFDTLTRQTWSAKWLFWKARAHDPCRQKLQTQFF